MPESISDYLGKRGSIGLLTLLSMEGGMRFSDLEDELTISSSTLTRRIAEARGHGLVIPEMDPQETSVKDLYRITDRGALVARQMERQSITTACRTVLDYQHKIDEEMGDLIDWVDANQERLAGLNDEAPFHDSFGENITDRGGDPEYPDEFMEDSGSVDD